MRVKLGFRDTQTRPSITEEGRQQYAESNQEGQQLCTTHGVIFRSKKPKVHRHYFGAVNAYIESAGFFGGHRFLGG